MFKVFLAVAVGCYTVVLATLLLRALVRRLEPRQRRPPQERLPEIRQAERASSIKAEQARRRLAELLEEHANTEEPGAPEDPATSRPRVVPIRRR